MKTKIDTVECIVCGQTVPTTEAVCDEKIMDYVCNACALEAVKYFHITDNEAAMLTNLVKKELIHIWNYDPDRRVHTIQLSDFGFRLYQYLKGGTNETHHHAN